MVAKQQLLHISALTILDFLYHVIAGFLLRRERLGLLTLTIDDVFIPILRDVDIGKILFIWSQIIAYPFLFFFIPITAI